jgi:hypothetical protein
MSGGPLTSAGRVAAAALIASTVLTNGCQFPLSLWIAPASIASALVFGISERRNGSESVELNSIHVFRCSDIYDRGEYGRYPPRSRAAWGAYLHPDSGTVPIKAIRYGEVPAGLQPSPAAQPLQVLVCYVVLAYARDTRGDMRSATVGFRVSADGTVREMSRRQYAVVFSQRNASRDTCPPSERNRSFAPRPSSRLTRACSRQASGARNPARAGPSHDAAEET